MSEAEALATSTGFFNLKHNDGWLYGYLGFTAANVLVATGKYKFFRVDCWGYIVESI